jgi:MFS transporter, DHA1 family, putative efflux transporter
MAGIASVRRIRIPAALATAWVSLFVVGTDLFVVSPLLPQIARDYRIAAPLAGLSVTAFALSYMVTAPLFGHLADRIGRRRVLIGCLYGFGAANLLSAAAGTLLTLVAARALAGCAAAGVTPSIYALVSDRASPGQRATWLATAVSGLLMSLSLGAPLGALAGARFGWPVVFAAFGALCIPLVWSNRLVWPQQQAVAGGGAVSGRAPALGTAAPRLALTVLWSTALYGMYTYLGAGLDGAGFAAERIAEVILFYGAGAVVGNLIGGYLADRLGSRVVIAASLFLMAVGFLALRLALHSELLVGPAFAVASAAAQLFFPAQQAGLAADFPARRATLLAWNNAALFLGISLGSAIGGQATAVGGFAADLAVSAAIGLGAWLMHSLIAASSARPQEVVEAGRT